MRGTQKILCQRSSDKFCQISQVLYPFTRTMAAAGLLLMAQIATGQSVQAEEFSDELAFYQLENQIVVTATRSQTSLRKAPAAVYVITAKQIDERGYRTLADALQDVPGFEFQRNYGIFPELIHQRGLVGNNQRSLVYINGVLDNNISENAMLAGTIRYPLQNVDRIEIISGPASALYGANAFNGVINIITQNGNQNPGREFKMQSGSWNQEFNHLGKSASLSLRGAVSDENKQSKADYSISVYLLQDDGPDFGGVQQLDENNLGYYWSPLYSVSDSESYNITATFNYDQLRFQLVNWQYLQGDGTFANGTQQIDTDKNGFKGSSWDFRHNSASVAYLHEVSKKLSLDSEMVIRHSEILSSSHEQYPNQSGPVAYNDPQDTMILGGSDSSYARPDIAYELEERLQWVPNPDWSVTFGIELVNTVVPKGYGDYQRYQYQNHASYLQTMVALNDITSLIAGYRFDHNTNYGISHTPRIGAVLTPGELTIKTLLSTGFRAPTAWESYNSTPQRLANENLQPETMLAAELGLGYRLLKNYYIAVQSYYNQIDQLLLEVKTDQMRDAQKNEYWLQNQNVGEAKIFGLELQADIQASESLTFFANYNYSHSEYQNLPETLVSSPTVSGSNAIPNIAPHKWNLGVTYYLLIDLSLHLRANYVHDRKTIHSNPINNVAGYTLLHGNIRWNNAFAPGLYIELLLRNLFDAKAFDPGIRSATGGYYPTMHPIEGRNVWLTLGYRF